MLDLFIGLKRVIKRRVVHIDNSVFRLHWLFTSIMFISCSLIVTSRQYVGDPIDCLQTDDIPSSVLNTYCWIHSTYTIPSAFDKIVGLEVAHPGIEKSKNKNYEETIDFNYKQSLNTIKNSSINLDVKSRNINYSYRSNKYRKYYTYYQWVCFALFIQAIFFYLPYYIWKLWEGGLLKAITLGTQLALLSDEERGKKRKILNDYLYSHLNHHKMYAYKYFFCEFLCFVNVTGQFYLTDWFFDGEFFEYGIKVIRYAKHDQSITFDPMIFIFPRMTKCTFHSYGFSGDVQRHDALCMLPLNVVNEKIYIFIWFWLALLWFLLICVLVYRTIILLAIKWRAFFLTKRCTLSYFEDLEYICRNGNIGDWFLLYMLGSNLDPLIMRDVTEEISSRMKKREKKEIRKKNYGLGKKKKKLDDYCERASLVGNIPNSSAPCLPNHIITDLHCNSRNNNFNLICHKYNEYNLDEPSSSVTMCSLKNNDNSNICNNYINQMNKNNLIEDISVIKPNEFIIPNCIRCINQQQSNYNLNKCFTKNKFSFSEQSKEDIEKEETNDSFENNQETIAANHRLKKNSINNLDIKVMNHPKNLVINKKNSIKENDDCTLNATKDYSIECNNLSKSSNSYCSNKTQIESGLSSLENSSSGVFLDYENKSINSNSEISIQEENLSNHKCNTENVLAVDCHIKDNSDEFKKKKIKSKENKNELINKDKVNNTLIIDKNVSCQCENLNSKTVSNTSGSHHSSYSQNSSSCSNKNSIKNSKNNLPANQKIIYEQKFNHKAIYKNNSLDENLQYKTNQNHVKEKRKSFHGCSKQINQNDLTKNISSPNKTKSRKVIDC